MPASPGFRSSRRRSPRNVFVPLRLLQGELSLPEQANVILVAGSSTNLAAALREKVTLNDWGLRLRTPADRALTFFHLLAPNNDDDRLKPARWRGRVPEDLAKKAEANKGLLTRDMVIDFYEKHHPYVSLESRQLLLPPAVVDAARPFHRAGVFVYLADQIASRTMAQHYVVIAAVPKPDDAEKPLGPRDIRLVDTPQAPWQAAPGSKVTVGYYRPDDHNHLGHRSVDFTVRAIVPMRGDLDDPDLTPVFPGITDKLSMGSWENPPFPYNPKLVTKADEDYWTRYRATPRAYVSMDTARMLWGSRFGDLTSLQFSGIPADRLARELLANLAPERGGFVFQPVRTSAETASSGSSDFGELFVYFSFFLIVASLLLVGLLFRLNLDRRASEIGLLLAVGWSHGRVRALLLAEGATLAIVGGALGLVGALAYGRLMLDLLRATWPGGASLNFLRLHAEPVHFGIGFVGSVVVSALTVFWATRMLGKLSARALLAGETTSGDCSAARSGRSWARWVLALAVAGAAGCVVAGFGFQGATAQALSFLGSGALLLVASLAGVWIWLRSTGRQCTPRPSLTALGVRNAGRHAVRSLLTVGLLASATFLIVAVESFHKDTGTEFLARRGGSGGCALVAETGVPIYQDLNQAAVRRELGFTDPVFERVQFVACRVNAGDDASCLNLYRALQPRVLGVPPYALAGRFRFGAALAETPGEKADPWSMLGRSFADGAIPAVVDATTAEYGLHKSLGDTVEVTNDRGEKVPLRIVGLLDESIFQSEIVISDDNFRKLFPRQEGFSFFLVECNGPDAADDVPHVQSRLETALADQGVRVQTAADRVQAYLAVENMYLATFQALGGLGLVLGAVGLAIILLRGVWERRGELALLRALGFSSARLAWLVLAENLALLVLGLAAGTVAALLAVAPHLAGAARTCCGCASVGCCCSCWRRAWARAALPFSQHYAPRCWRRCGASEFGIPLTIVLLGDCDA